MSDQKEIGKQIEELLTMIEQNTLRRYSTLESAENAFDVVKKKLLEALHNTPLLSYLREKKKELDEKAHSFMGRDEEGRRYRLVNEALYDFLSETLEKFDNK